MKQKTNMLVTKETGEKALKLKQKINMRMEDILILDYLSLNQTDFKEINKLEGEKIIFAVSRSKILENIMNSIQGFSYSAKTDYILRNSQREHKKVVLEVTKDIYTEFKEEAKKLGISTKLFAILLTEEYTKTNNLNKKEFEKKLMELDKRSSVNLSVFTTEDNAAYLRKFKNRVLDAAFDLYKKNLEYSGKNIFFTELERVQEFNK